jgi:hypothetical protein
MSHLHKTIKITRGDLKADKVDLEKFRKILDSYYDEENDVHKVIEKFKPEIKVGHDLVDYDGLGVTKGGTPYLKLRCCSLCEVPVRAYMYLGEGEIKTYVPKKGNVLRIDEGCAFGSDNPGTRNQYISENIDDPNSDYYELKINDEWCLEDFETHLGE